MKDEEYRMFLEWALLSQTQVEQNRDILENIQLFIHEPPEFQDEGLNEWFLLHVVERKVGGDPVLIKEVKEKESVFEKIRKALYTLVDELNGVIESLIEL